MGDPSLRLFSFLSMLECCGLKSRVCIVLVSIANVGPLVVHLGPPCSCRFQLAGFVWFMYATFSAYDDTVSIQIDVTSAIAPAQVMFNDLLLLFVILVVSVIKSELTQGNSG